MKGSFTGLFVKTAIVVFAVFCVIMIIRYQFVLNEKKLELQELEERLEGAEKTVAELENEKERLDDDEYIIEKARELGLCFPDEVIVYSGN